MTLLLTLSVFPSQAVAEEALPPAAQEAIALWQQDTYSRYRQIADLEISFTRDLVTVKERYLRIDCHCNILLKRTGNVFKLTKSFHLSLATEKLLELEDFLIAGASERLDFDLADETGASAAITDWRLTENGLTLYAARGIRNGALPLSKKTLSEVLIWDGSTIWDNRPVIALTFDDGPSGKTPRLLDILETYNARATFFVVGNMIGGREELLAEMYAAGHEIGGHSWNHADLTELSRDSLYSQLSRTKYCIEAATGGNSSLMRPPYGATNGTVSSVAGSLGLSSVLWNIDTLDWMYLDADKVYDVIMAEARNGRIVLCHDLYESTVDAMERVIPALLKQGYQLVTVSELRAR